MKKIHREEIETAARILRSGGVIVYPAETVYGIGCDPWNRDAVERILTLKRREGERTMLLLADTEKMANETVGGIEGLAARIAGVFWPGPLTIVLKPFRELPDYLYGPSGGVAFRVTSHPVAAALIREFGKPIISTSANLSGSSPATTHEEAMRIFGDSVDLAMHTPTLLGGAPSTVVDVVSGRAALIREGAIPFSRILEAVG